MSLLTPYGHGEHQKRERWEVAKIPCPTPGSAIAAIITPPDYTPVSSIRGAPSVKVIEFCHVNIFSTANQAEFQYWTYPPSKSILQKSEKTSWEGCTA